MATLNDILNIDLGLGEGAEKTASADQGKELTELEKLAASLGLTEENSENQAGSKGNNGLNKEASMSLDTIYSDMFPGDADIVGQEKFASSNEDGITKEAAALEEAIGARAYDYFLHYNDAHITKIASEIADHMEHEIPGKLEDNEDKSKAAINTTPDLHVADKAMGHNPAGAVGEFSAQAKEASMKTAALRKHMLLLATGGSNE